MRPGWNPVRRNRHIGTERQGHGQDNRLVVPDGPSFWTPFWSDLTAPTVIERRFGAKTLTFLIEAARPGWFHPCTPDDIDAVLRHCPETDLDSFDLIVLRQPTRKQDLLSGVWGRAIFYFEWERHRGRAVVLEAKQLGTYRWNRTRSVEMQRELERLEQDGHRVRSSRHRIEITPTATAMRHTQLYRTLLHEIGHHLDYNAHRQDEALEEAWDQRPSREKEDFAHRHAEARYADLARAGHLPFAPRFDPAALAADGLDPAWFRPPADDEASAPSPEGLADD